MRPPFQIFLFLIISCSVMANCSEGSSKNSDKTVNQFNSKGSSELWGDVVINEVSAQGDDPIELYNRSNAHVDLSGWSLLDNKSSHQPYVFPVGSTLAPETFVVIRPRPTHFGLGKQDSLRLLSPTGIVIDEVTWTDGDASPSWCRYPDGEDTWTRCKRVTPGEVNSLARLPYEPDLITMGQNLPTVVPVLSITIGGTPIRKDEELQGTLEIFEDHAGTLEDLDTVTPTLITPIGIQGRGNFTWSLPKKGYGIELQDALGAPNNQSILGMPPGNDFALYACYTDKTCLRNALVFGLSQELGQWSPRTRFVEVVLDGEYMGLYMLWERVRRDGHRTVLDKPGNNEETGDLTGGYIIRLEGAGKGNVVVDGISVSRDFSTTSGRIYTYHYPDTQRINPDQSAYIRNFMEDFELAMRVEPNEFRSWIDVPSWIDHAIVEEVTNNWDGYVHSIYMTKASERNGGLLGMGPLWDFDLAFGNGNVTGYNCRVDTWAYENIRPEPDDVPPYWLALFASADFKAEFGCRYQELRSGPLSLDTFERRIQAWVDFTSQARMRDQERWPTIGHSIFPNCNSSPTYEEEVRTLQNWIRERLEWMDDQLPVPENCP